MYRTRGESHLNLLRSPWLIEIAFLLLGIVIFAVIVAVLRIYDQKPLPSWPLNITLNAFLALFTAFAQACFMIPLAETLGQWKWNVYAKPGGRPLQDFHILDSASRGFWGSMWLMAHFRWTHLVTVAGLVSAISVLSSPITQQALNYPIRQVDQRNGSSFTTANQKWIATYHLPFERAMSEGIHSTVDVQIKPTGFTCPTADCTFSKYRSLAICMKMADVSDRLTVETISNSSQADWTIGGLTDAAVALNHSTAYNASLPNGPSIVTPVPYAILFEGGSSSLMFANDDAMSRHLANEFLVYSLAEENKQTAPNVTKPPMPQWKFGALEVLFYFCINEYTTETRAGESVTTAEELAVKQLNGFGKNHDQGLPRLRCQYPRGQQRSYNCDTSPFDDEELQLRQYAAFAPLESTLEGGRSQTGNFSFWGYSALNLASRFQRGLFNHYVWGGIDGQRGPITNSEIGAWLFNVIYGDVVLGQASNSSDKALTVQRLEKYFQNLANSTSNFIRSGEGAMVVNGITHYNEPYVNIRWGYLAFLAIEILLSLAFLMYTIFETWRLKVPVLMSSALANLIVLEDGAQRALGSIGDIRRAEERTKNIHVSMEQNKLVPQGDGTFRVRDIEIDSLYDGAR